MSQLGLGIFLGYEDPNRYRSEKSGFGLDSDMLKYPIGYTFIYVSGTGSDQVLPEIRTTLRKFPILRSLAHLR